MNDLKKRSIVKTITWRVTGSAATFLIAFVMTGDVAVAGVIGVVQMFVNTLLYYFHERIWNQIGWGKN